MDIFRSYYSELRKNHPDIPLYEALTDVDILTYKNTVGYQGYCVNYHFRMLLNSMLAPLNRLLKL